MKEERTVILALVGESGSGKSTIGEEIEKLGFNYIQSFTSRKPRYENEKGHIFTTEKQYFCNRANRQIVADTFFDGAYYWTTKGQLNGKCLYIIDPLGVKRLKENNKGEIIVIYLKANRQNRFIRMMARDKDEEKVKKRLEHDEVVFKDVETIANYIVNADRPIKDVLEDVREIINNKI